MPDSSGPPAVYEMIEVADSGAGLDSEACEGFFQPSLDAQGSGSGANLGLAVVERIIDDVGGFVGVDSLPGQGTVVRMYLPRIAAEA